MQRLANTAIISATDISSIKSEFIERTDKSNNYLSSIMFLR